MNANLGAPRWLRIAALLTSTPMAWASAAADDDSPIEPLGPSSRRTGLVISEIMYNPAVRSDGRNLEYVEIHNTQPWIQDVSGFRLAGDIEFTFPSNTILSSNAFLVVAKVPADVRSDAPGAPVVGGYAGNLPDDNGSVRLEHRSGGVLIGVRYPHETPWPAAADGAGHSLVLARPSLGQEDPRAWSASARVGGSPGTWEPTIDEPRRKLRLSEFLAADGARTPDFVELHNSGADSMDLSGCILTDDPFANRCVLPSGTTLAPGGFMVLEGTRLGFGLNRSGETIYLWNPSRSAVLDAVRFGPQADGRSSGRVPGSSGGFRILERPTPGGPNAGALVAEVVINEIMYDPISEDGADEYVELHNQGQAAVDVGGWRFVDGIEFTVPSATVIPPGGFLVVAKSVARLRSHYPDLTAANTVGDYQGSLDNGGERLALARADGVLVEEVTYGVGGRWGQWAHGGGSSLERVDPRSDPACASSWADSDETGKAPWTTVEFTGRLSAGALSLTVTSPRSLYVVMLGPGECLLDDVEVMKAGGPNLVTNSTFQAGVAGWLGQGNHERIAWEPNGDNEGGSLRVCATDRGDTAMNRVRTRLGAGLTSTATATLRARARWQRGCPEILLRLLGNYLEAYGRLPVPANLGTPGARNSRARPNTGPAIEEVRHRPALPEAGQPIVVTARVTDPDGLAEILLHYRLDPATNRVFLPMTDDGQGGDALAGDGTWTATLPGQAAQTLVALSVSARDQADPPAVSFFPSDAPRRECLVRVGETLPAGPFGTYRFWMTQATHDRWRRREPSEDEPLDVTFVYGQSRVVYNVGALYAGSPNAAAQNYDGPTGASCDYTLVFPGDDRFLGVTDVRLSWPGLAGRLPDDTLQTEQAAFWLAEQMGLAACHRRHVYLFVNGVRRGSLVEDSQKPGADYLEEWFAGESDGELYKLLNHYEWGDTGSVEIAGAFGRALNRPELPPDTPPERAYRWMWNKRATHGSQNDLRSVYSLIDAFNLGTGEGYTERIEALVDARQWLRTLAVERFVGNWDSFVYANDQNMYFYKPREGKWHLCIWDMDLMMGRRTGGLPVNAAPQESIFLHETALFPGLTVSTPEKQFLAHPPFRRVYLRSLQQLIDGPVSRLHEILNAKEAVFLAQGIPTASPDYSLADVTRYVSNRVASIRKQLLPYQSRFMLETSDGTVVTNSEPIAVLTGRASLELEGMRVNGAALPLHWTTTTNWSVAVPLTELTNRLTLTGFDEADRPLPGAAGSVTLLYTGRGLPERLPVFINEWMAANVDTIADPADGDYEDWFELHNPNAVAVDLFGYRLTDDPANPAKFVIPADWSIPAGGLRLIWADEEGSQSATSSDLHVNFKLSRAGETIALFDPAGRLVDSVTFGAQTEGISQGRWPDGASAPYVPFGIPSPGAANGAGDPARLIHLHAAFSAPGRLALTWEAVPGARYRVESKTGLEEASWTPLEEVVATTSSVTLTRPITSEDRRFYRVRLER